MTKTIRCRGVDVNRILSAFDVFLLPSFTRDLVWL